MKTRAILFVSLGLSLVALVFGIYRFIESRTVTTFVTAPTVSENVNYYYVPIPQIDGFPYGDCFKGAERIGYLPERDCVSQGGDSWIQEDGE